MIYTNDYLDAYNGTHAEFQKKKLHELLVDAVRTYEQHIAIHDADDQITYGELLEASISLSEKFDATGQPVAVMAHRSISTITQLYAILLSGNYYIPIDPSAPLSRKQQILDKTEARYLFDGGQLIALHRRDVNLPFQEKMGEDDQLAYIMFTSGSTGEPKGVVESHYQVYNTLMDMKERMQLTQHDGFLCLASLCFDLSVFDIFGAALTGGTLHLVKDQRDFADIGRMIEDRHVTIWNSVPSVMDYFLREIELSERAKNNMRVCLMSGDFISKDLAQTTLDTFGKAAVYSLGGATECSIWSILYNITPNNINNHSFIPYGHPMANQSIWILNQSNALCAYGEEGQIAIGGDGVSLGYVNDDSKTSAAFIDHPQLGCLYLTGDIGKFVSPDYVKFIGRKDSQAKVNGYRISLSQISNTFLNLFGMKNKVVIIQDEKDKDKLALVYESEKAMDISKARSELSDYLTLYEMPHLFYSLEKFPLTNNGKVDTSTLTSIAQQSYDKRGVKATDQTSETDSAFRTMLKEVFGMELIGCNDSLFELGVDSIQLVKIKNWIEENEKKEISLLDIYTLDEIGKLEAEIYS